MSARFRTPDGELVTIEAQGYDLEGQWSATVRTTPLRPYTGAPEAYEQKEFHITPVGNYDYVLRHVIDGRWANRVELHGGRLLVGHSDSADQGLIVWQGDHHEVATFTEDPRIPGSRAVEFFEGLRFTDDPEGLVVQSDVPEVETLDVLDVGKIVPEVGYIDIRRPEIARRLVPTWAGAKVETGEVWREQIAAPDEPEYVLLLHATETTVNLLTGEGEDKARVEPRLEFLERLTELAWTGQSESNGAA